MHILHSDSVFHVDPGTTPDYRYDNPLLALLRVVEQIRYAAGLENYILPSSQHLLSIKKLEFYGPSGGDHEQLDPRLQDNKEDFQKQNIRSFELGSTLLTRGWAAAGEWVGPYIKASYRGTDTPLSEARPVLGDRISLWLKIGDGAAVQFDVPIDRESQRYEIELWGHPGDPRPHLNARGRQALETGALVLAPQLVLGSLSDFDRDKIDGKNVRDIAPGHAMHPIRPLHVELAWSDAKGEVWDSQGGRNYHFEFSMVMRGWENFLSIGNSQQPHGGIGELEYRNLMSNYFAHRNSMELARALAPWNFDAFQVKHPDALTEKFMAVDYIDLHILRANSGIGLHRHRDNQEIFLCMQGRGFMVVGDWCKMPNRERCFEVRTLLPGHFALLKGGNLHGLMNATDEDMHLFMFGGYD
ncbi:MAG TPA: cupin domain-containing protein [Noviherbaspirillum sp.]|nr:cupin domain-containing protein [Noviherbaspirillum sp.]